MSRRRVPWWNAIATIVVVGIIVFAFADACAPAPAHWLDSWLPSR